MLIQRRRPFFESKKRPDVSGKTTVCFIQNIRMFEIKCEFVFKTTCIKTKKIRKALTLRNFHAERQALEPTYSRNIIKLQIINNQALFGVHSKSKSF